MGLKTTAELHRHPRLGSLWESFAMEQVIQLIQAENALSV